MKKKRKKCCPWASLPLHTSLGSAPDVPESVDDVEKSFADDLFGSKKADYDFMEKIFDIKVTENASFKWETIIFNQQMFILIPTDLSQVGSKESFVALLEIAEEDLGCTTVISCVRNGKSKRSAHLRTFMYMGFETITPGNPLLPDCCGDSEKFIFLGYEI